jgi:tellurite resistance protein TerC
MTETIGTPLLWGLFLLFVFALLALDLGVFHRKEHRIGIREAILWSLVWTALALAFNVWIYLRFGRQPGLEFLTGYVIERSLSFDNIFVFVLIFSYFRVPAELQHRVLFWGILGALVSRGLFIGLGTALIQRFTWIILIFGGFLVYTGFKVLRGEEAEVHPEDNPVVKLFRRLMPVLPSYRGKSFLVEEGGRRMATLLLLVLVVVEATDVVFAVDSIPAVFGVTTDPFIVFTSNIFAILGLRALYFLLAGLMHQFRYLNLGLGVVLMFVGAKMLGENWRLVPGWLGLEVSARHHWFEEIPTSWSLGIVLGVLVLAGIASLLRPGEPASPPDPT